ncbi:hypothetical protein ACFFQF_13195 [Haladaptatus pallidirubidus]|uniref:hypothetical protein n=1 Tax=Haladaptatus pallidirubidus TaxID=1008152 RepID=UPI001D118FF6|nr:hypothetical protein [Haladaptatus pallidirubidus]
MDSHLTVVRRSSECAGATIRLSKQAMWRALARRLGYDRPRRRSKAARGITETSVSE